MFFHAVAPQFWSLYKVTNSQVLVATDWKY